MTFTYTLLKIYISLNFRNTINILLHILQISCILEYMSAFRDCPLNSEVLPNSNTNWVIPVFSVISTILPQCARSDTLHTCHTFGCDVRGGSTCRSPSWVTFQSHLDSLWIQASSKAPCFFIFFQLEQEPSQYILEKPVLYQHTFVDHILPLSGTTLTFNGSEPSDFI